MLSPAEDVLRVRCAAVLLLVLSSVLTAARGESNIINDLDDAVSVWDSFVHCDITLEVGSVCKIHVSNIKPTQFAYSPSEVMKKREMHEELYRTGKSEKRAQRRVPLVLGPDGYYITDRHHFSKSLLHASIPYSDKWIICEVIAKWDSLEEEPFWRLMHEHSFVWLHDHNGLGPMHPSFLPRTLHHLQPDPFRTLAYFLRINGVFNDNGFYTEFKWGMYLRQSISLPSEPESKEWEQWCTMQPSSQRCLPPAWDELEWVKSVFDDAVLLAHATAARHLPGYMEGSSD